MAVCNFRSRSCLIHRHSYSNSSAQISPCFVQNDITSVKQWFLLFFALIHWAGCHRSSVSNHTGAVLRYVVVITQGTIFNQRVSTWHITTNFFSLWTDNSEIYFISFCFECSSSIEHLFTHSGDQLVTHYYVVSLFLLSFSRVPSL